MFICLHACIWMGFLYIFVLSWLMFSAHGLYLNGIPLYFCSQLTNVLCTWQIYTFCFAIYIMPQDYLMHIWLQSSAMCIFIFCFQMNAVLGKIASTALELAHYHSGDGMLLLFLLLLLFLMLGPVFFVETLNLKVVYECFDLMLLDVPLFGSLFC